MCLPSLWSVLANWLGQRRVTAVYVCAMEMEGGFSPGNALIDGEAMKAEQDGVMWAKL